MGDGGEGNALLKAVFQGKLRLTRLLLEGGAYINEGNERGETPVSAACIAAGYDSPLARQRMVRYLLEKGADPNIPDKQGRTALMHACAERAGKEVVSLLLENGADPSLKDYSGSSALVHAINRGDRDTLQVLLDACKARGKEVIIITTDTSPSGTKKTKQYLNAPPSPGLVDTKTSPSEVCMSPSESCMSPSEVLIGTTSGSPTEGSAKGEAGEAGREGGVFSFALTSALPLPAPTPRPAGGEKRPPPRKLLKRLNSEPWGLVAPSLLSGGPHGGLEEEEGTPGLSRVVKEMNGLSVTDPPAAAARPLLSRRHSIETHDPCSPKLMDRSCSEDQAQLYNSFWADRSLYRRNTAPEDQAQEGPAPARPQLAQEGPAPARPQLAHPKLTRMDHYESDAHLCPSHSIPGSPDSGRCVSVERRRFNTSPLSLLLGSSSSSRGSPRGSLEDVPSSVSPVTVRRRTPGILERRGSGTLLLDHISHSRPGFLPPLNLNPHRPLIPVIRANGVTKPPPAATSPVHSSSSSGGQRVLVPVAPASPNKRLCPDFKTKKKLLRRHSMQTEQMKQLSSFQELLAHKVCEASGD